MACANTKKCSLASDCKSGVCSGSVCVAPSCTDSVKNGDETDVDCGGTTCGACADSKKCILAGDCKSGVCTAGACAAPSCTDSVKNGVETDVDCGGGTCPKCADTKACAYASDCKSGVCDSAGKCAVPSCTDGVQNGKEIGVDCGGTCPPPATWYLDSDGDGHGAGAGTTACTAPGPKYVKKSSDCDDKKKDVYPGAPESWGDCVDSDCDGVDFSVGDGQDGDLTVTKSYELATSTTTLSATVAAGATQIVVKSAANLKAGNMVLIRVAAGVAAKVGTHELALIKSISGATLTLSGALAHGYGSTDTVNVTRVPQYKNVTVSATGTIAAKKWSGSLGGVVAFLVSGKLSVAAGGKISVNALGYRGGARATSAKMIGQQGESHKGTGTRTTAANLTGGGGGKAPSLAHACGGGGGYATAGAKGGRYNGYSTVAGAGGGTAGGASLGALLFGGAGGAGGLDADPGAGAYGGMGGYGGGVVLIIASSIDLAGTIVSSGGKGEDGKISGGASPGGGGGGAGGSVFLMVKSASSAKGGVSALGGSGGKGSEAGSAVTYGGKGGAGRIRVQAKTGSVTTSPKAYTSCP